jgi:UDP-N-acetyl-2-amino-2-deoxyglucuronate dehydrogenase
MESRRREVVEPIVVGIIGAGTIGQMHAAALAGLEGVWIAAVAEPREEAGRALAEQYGAEWVADEAELLARPDVDVVILATPSGLHADQAVRAAQAGKHVVTEKPMATTPADADRMIDAARAAGVQLAVIFQTRFNRDALRLKRAVEAGRFGRIVLGNALVHWHRTQEYYDATGGWRGTWALDGGGALINQSIHTIDLLQWIAGPVASVSAETATLAHRIETEDAASAALRFASGALGTIQGTTAAAADWPVRLEIVGTEGRAVLEGDRLTVWEPAGGDDGADLLTDEDRRLVEGAQAGEAFGTGHGRQLRAIFAALRAGEAPPVPGPEGRKAVEIIRAIYRSAQTGQRVTLPLTDGVPDDPLTSPSGR